jgi:hypothetical protein
VSSRALQVTEIDNESQRHGRDLDRFLPLASRVVIPLVVFDFVPQFVDLLEDDCVSFVPVLEATEQAHGMPQLTNDLIGRTVDGVLPVSRLWFGRGEGGV